MHFLIEKSRNLKGSYTPQGNKNEALPVIAASLLSLRPCHLSNLPDIIDVRVMLDLARALGASVEISEQGHAACINAAELETSTPDPEMAGRIRGSLLLAAPILARCGKALIQRPGGDRIGRRRIDTHLSVFRQLGASLSESQQNVLLEAPDGLRGGHVFLDEASVMATENALIAAATAKGETLIENAACEPHVQQLARLLKGMGVQIEGEGSNRIRIQGRPVAELNEVRHRVLEDHIEVGSLIALAAVTDSELHLPGITAENYLMIERVFARLGLKMHIGDTSIDVPGGQQLKVEYDHGGSIPRIHDAPWPGFPADLTSIAVTLAACAEGSVMIHEWMFESRLYWVDSLISMGARITQCDPHRVLVSGGHPLYGTLLHSPDIRAGMALLIAGLVAEGETVIHNIQQIDRGYERIEERLARLGASIRRVVD
jgi:UDP-N-acetylglucosamine 1-carboxyvinyltransferase